MVSEAKDISFLSPKDGLDTNPVSAATAPHPELSSTVVQLTKRGVVVKGPPDALQQLRQHFAANKWARLPGFLDAELLELLQRKIEESAFRVIDRSTGVELRPVDCTAYLAAELLLNSPKLFRAIEAVTGCERIACFSGRIYRRPPATDYFNRWHNDVTDEGRMIALSVNLSADSYSGGDLRIRSVATHDLIAEVHNNGIGDAIIFLIDESLQHQVGGVTGTTAKTALAGWFRAKPDPESLFGRGS